ncbi:hydroxyethylthiazole kinase [Clostridium sp.]|uniref:hydroxyethylthiazole kinase n=1 Tax=Clostridium sp. TaxID=1506 RepID=UPI003FA5A35F
MGNVKANKPLIHNITNYVTVNDCANILLGCGASPLMTDEILEADDITAISSGLNINIGTLNSRTIEAMKVYGKKASEVGKPIVLDPVGAGASTLRTNTVNDLLKEVNFTVIKGNISEIKSILYKSGNTSGVDASEGDLFGEDSFKEGVEIARKLSRLTGAVIVITGEIDIVSTEDESYIVRNGHPLMAKVTGTGCMLSSLIAAYISANRESILEATVVAVCLMGVAGEVSYTRLNSEQGNGSYKVNILDVINNADESFLSERGRYELI